QGPAPRSAASICTRNSGASSTSCPRARKVAAVRSPSASGRVTSRRTGSRQGEEFGAAALLELAAGVGAERGSIGDDAFAPGLESLAAVGFGDQAAEADAARRDR